MLDVWCSVDCFEAWSWQMYRIARLGPIPEGLVPQQVLSRNVQEESWYPEAIGER
jgi:hypothetical protein